MPRPAIPLPYPTHPDFKYLRQALRSLDELDDLDGRTERDFLSNPNLSVDPASVRYAAFQRAAKVLPRPLDPGLSATIAALWAEAVIVGLKVAELRAADALANPESEPDDPGEQLYTREDPTT